MHNYIFNIDIRARLTLVSMILYAVGMYVEIIRQWIDTQREQAKTAEQLRESRLQLLIGQMKPHFLYNTLNSVNILIAKDPKKASQLLCSFSKYMRANMYSLEDARLIPFMRELDIVRVYLDIVGARFGDDIVVFQDIRVSDFLVPPLSVQTLVENAVSHGIRQKTGPSEIRITSTATKNGFKITVEDTGKGFDTSAPISDKSTGLRNTRLRLEEMSQGSLLVESAPGKGTRATVFIPAIPQNML